MVHAASFLLASMLAMSVSALPAPTPECGDDSDMVVTAEDLIAIDSNTATCDGAKFADECATAADAAPAISASFEKYGIETPGEQAALIAIMLFESGSFKYNKNHYSPTGPRPGQGTRNMQGEAYNKQYAAEVMPTAASSSGDALTAALNKEADISFGSAAWYLTKAEPGKCTQQIRGGLAAATKEGWNAYLTQCVGTPADPARDVSWRAAIKVLRAGQ
ncbi:hypothetical protein K458DRAFT_420224 [Lentithecium fluviatile CBS 122367]|uniref:Uncharacterized protein n=1 Tax=Lentithecium fluviatile CBS 122367 TaxID=1168545 RepID=A0A6G1IUC8_9PLEO|nr:hypothetical protein K458DRAFT_420224 [Lentithecium fluviatile CBS 122367]